MGDFCPLSKAELMHISAEVISIPMGLFFNKLHSAQWAQVKYAMGFAMWLHVNHVYRGVGLQPNASFGADDQPHDACIHIRPT